MTRARRRYAVLLRGINVGGKNVIPMATLQRCFERLGCGEVATYIQSGNVVLSDGRSPAELSKRVEAALSTAFGYAAKVVLLDARSYRKVMAEAPKGFGVDQERFRFDVMFVRPPMTPVEAIADVPAKAGVDEVSAGSLALYYRRVAKKAEQSLLAKLSQRAVYQHLTVRNWNTTSAIAELLDG